jgi:hypothetical protein
MAQIHSPRPLQNPLASGRGQSLGCSPSDTAGLHLALSAATASAAISGTRPAEQHGERKLPSMTQNIHARGFGITSVLGGLKKMGATENKQLMQRIFVERGWLAHLSKVVTGDDLEQATKASTCGIIGDDDKVGTFVPCSAEPLPSGNGIPGQKRSTRCSCRAPRFIVSLRDRCAVFPLLAVSRGLCGHRTGPRGSESN